MRLLFHHVLRQIFRLFHFTSGQIDQQGYELINFPLSISFLHEFELIFHCHFWSCWWQTGIGHLTAWTNFSLYVSWTDCCFWRRWSSMVKPRRRLKKPLRRIFWFEKLSKGWLVTNLVLASWMNKLSTKLFIPKWIFCLINLAFVREKESKGFFQLFHAARFIRLLSDRHK